MADITDAGQRLRQMNDALELDERLRLTDKERLAIQWVVGDALSVDGVSIQATLRGLLERHFPTPENQSSQDNAPETHTKPSEGSVQDSVT